jgi:alpha-L-fucosidase
MPTADLAGAGRTRAWPDTYGDPSWLQHDRFGLFIHWGLYSTPARHEWVQNKERIPPDEYRDRYFDHFDPDRFDAHEWAEAARDAGMRYAVLTAKHHEGFCLWDSALTDFKATNTAGGRDLIAEYVEAFRSAGLKVGLYYSLIDWHHPEFPIDGLHPLRDDETARKEQRDIAVYRQYLHGQVEELLTNYGTIDYLWFDFTYADADWGWSKGKGPSDWGSEDLERLVLKLQPDILLNDRLGLNRGVRPTEQHVPDELLDSGEGEVVWEACHTENGSWGYDRDNGAWKRPVDVAQLLVDVVSKGGNLLFNVGPTGRGQFGPRSRQLLASVGEWLDLHGDAIYGAGRCDLPAPQDCRLTQRGNRIYVHVFAWRTEISVAGLPPLALARLLHDHSEVQIAPHALGGPERLMHLPAVRPDVLVPVIECIVSDDGNDAYAGRRLPPPGFNP